MMRGIRKFVIVVGVAALLAPAVSWAADNLVSKTPQFQSGPVAPKVVFRHDDGGSDPNPPGRLPVLKPLPPPQALSSQTLGVSRLGSTPGVASLASASPQQKLESRLKNLALELR